MSGMWCPKNETPHWELLPHWDRLKPSLLAELDDSNYGDSQAQLYLIYHENEAKSTTNHVLRKFSWKHHSHAFTIIVRRERN